MEHGCFIRKEDIITEGKNTFPTHSLARALEFAVMSRSDKESWQVPIEIILAVGEVRQLIDEFPDEEVDEVLVAFLRRKIDTNGERIIKVGRVLGINLFYANGEPETRWASMLAVP